MASSQVHCDAQSCYQAWQAVKCLYDDIAVEDLSWLNITWQAQVELCLYNWLTREEERGQVEAQLAEEAAQLTSENKKAKQKKAMDNNLAAQRIAEIESQRRSNGRAYGLVQNSASSENSGIESCMTSTDDSLLKKTKKSIGKFFYESGLDFNAINSPSFWRMISIFSGQINNQFPTCEELKGWIFDDAVKEMREYVDEIRNSWADTGCSILLDGWTDANGRNLINILVDCPKGTVYLGSSDITDFVGNMDAMQLFFEKILVEVGVNNVVQIITYSNSAFMKEVGRQLMEKYRPIFWTVSASRCIEVMLEKLEEMDLIKETLDKAKTIMRFILSHPDALNCLQGQSSGSNLVNPSKIRSIQPFETLENIVVEKEILKKVFLSSDSLSSILTSTMEGKRVAELVADRSFWSGASTILKGAIPLVRVIEWMHDSNKEQIGYIYETIDQAKETIKEEFKHKKSQYAPFWKVIDDVWNELLYNPLHSAGYFLNPNLFYSSDVYIDPEVVTGLFCCIVRSTEDLRVQDRITIQMEQYRTTKGAFGIGYRADQRSNFSPALWWSKYGGECPELQRLAVRILSQTCDGASKFQLKRSWAESLLTKRRNQMQEKWYADMIFLRYNIQLQNFASRKTDHMPSDDVDPMDDWIMGKARNGMSENDAATSMELDGGSTTDQGVVNFRAFWFSRKLGASVSSVS